MMKKCSFCALFFMLLFSAGCAPNLPTLPTPIHVPANPTAIQPTMITNGMPTVIPPTVTPVPPTATATPIPPTETATGTSVPPTETATHTPVPPTETASPAPAAAGWLRPPLHTTWQIQYAGEMDFSPPVGVFNLDLFETRAEDIARLHERGIYVMCYFSAGSWENWRPDAGQFPQEVIGKALEGWPGESWLDIRQIDLLQPLMDHRLDMAVEKGCDGVDPDNINGYEDGNETGFPLTYDDQLAYNIYLAEAAHARGLGIGLKNDIAQIGDLLPYFDWALNESCFTYEECDLLTPFIEQHKPVFVIEYELQPEDFCPQANQLGFNALFKHWNLDAWRVDCRGGDYLP